jgi:hypothetical protein
MEEFKKPHFLNERWDFLFLEWEGLLEGSIKKQII